MWDIQTGRERATVPLPGRPECLGCHPSRPHVVAAIAGGDLFPLDLVNVAYGPLVVTALDTPAGLVMRCPACGRPRALDRGRLGQVVDCEASGCGGRLRVNPFAWRA